MRIKNHLIIYFLFFGVYCFICHAKVSLTDKNTVRVWLTVASTVSDKDDIVRKLEIHWRRPASHPKPDAGDYVSIVSIDSGTEIRKYLLNQTETTDASSTNIVATDLTFPYTNFSSHQHLVDFRNSQLIVSTDLFNSSKKFNSTLKNCLHYYVVYYSSKVDDVVAIDCVRLNFEWMKENYQLLKDNTLLRMMLPGTHDATSYEPYDSTYEGDVITRFQYTQDESIFNQLAYGIRYLDLRVGAFNRTEFTDDWSLITYEEELWFVHDIERNHINVTQGLREIRKFLKETTHEIVIADFHRFVTGFDDVDDWNAVNHRLKRLYNVLVEELGDYLIPYRSSLALGDLIKSGKRLLVGYQYKNDRRNYFDSSLLWPNVQHLWAQTDEFDRLEHFIEMNVCKRHDYFTSVMAELTPTVQGVLFLKYHGLRELAEQVNVHYDHWFRERWWNCANIVAADFFLGSDIVQIAIDANRRRFT